MSVASLAAEAFYSVGVGLIQTGFVGAFVARLNPSQLHICRARLRSPRRRVERRHPTIHPGQVRVGADHQLDVGASLGSRSTASPVRTSPSSRSSRPILAPHGKVGSNAPTDATRPSPRPPRSSFREIRRSSPRRLNLHAPPSRNRCARSPSLWSGVSPASAMHAGRYWADWTLSLALT